MSWDTRRAQREKLRDDASGPARKTSSKMAEDIVLPIPNLNLAQQLFVLSKPGLAALQNDARNTLLEGIKADRAYNRIIGLIHADVKETEMAPYYKMITSAPSGLVLDQVLLEGMEKANEDELKQLDERLEEAEKTEGESEISDALRAKANFLTRIGDKVSSGHVLLSTELTGLVGSSHRCTEARTRENTGIGFQD